jgi:hypothetical protein
MATATGTPRTTPDRRSETLRLPRTTGAVSGLLIVALGIWAGLIPFIGPYFHYAFGSYQSWHYTDQRLWLDIVPAAVAVIGGLMLMTATSRVGGLTAGWVALAAGAWFVVGPPVSVLWHHTIYPIGTPTGGYTRQTLEWVGYFDGVGALIIALAAFAMGRYFSRPRVVAEPAAVAADAAAADAAARGGTMTRTAVADAPAERTAVADAPERAAVRDEPVRDEPMGTVPAERGAVRDEPAGGYPAEREAAMRDEPAGAVPTVPAERETMRDEPVGDVPAARGAVRDEPVGAVPAERETAMRDEPVDAGPAERGAVGDEPAGDTAAADAPTTSVPTNTAPAATSSYEPAPPRTRRSGGLLGRFRR